MGNCEFSFNQCLLWNRTGNTCDDRSSPSSPTSTFLRLSYFGWCKETAAPCLETQTADTLNYPFCVGKTTPPSYSPWCVWRWCKLTSWALTFLAVSLFYLRLDSLFCFFVFFNILDVSLTLLYAFETHDYYCRAFLLSLATIKSYGWNKMNKLIMLHVGSLKREKVYPRRPESWSALFSSVPQ